MPQNFDTSLMHPKNYWLGLIDSLKENKRQSTWSFKPTTVQIFPRDSHFSQSEGRNTRKKPSTNIQI